MFRLRIDIFLPPNPFMTLSNQAKNKDKSEKFDFEANFTLELSTA